MILQVEFQESIQSFDVDFGEVHTISDGGFDRGYAEGYEEGNTDGYTKGHAEGVETGYANGFEKGEAEGYDKGHAEGLASRTYETWTITLADGTVIEKDVALL